MSRIYDKKVPQDLIKLGGTSMEWKFLDALVKELVEITGLPEDNSIKNLLKHSLHKFLINDDANAAFNIAKAPALGLSAVDRVAADGATDGAGEALRTCA